MEDRIISRKVYIVTHADKEKGPNPGLTANGKREISWLVDLLPKNPSEVVCGTGARHFDTVEALGLEVTRYTAVVGGPESGVKDADGIFHVQYPDGRTFPKKEGLETTVEDMSVAQVMLIRYTLPNNSVIIAGRPLMIGLDREGLRNSMKSTSVYVVEFNKSGNFCQIRALAEDGDIGAGKDEL